MMPTPVTKKAQGPACPSSEIAAYIDGELEQGRESLFEAHLAGCAVCSEELNHQKQFLLCLDSSLRNEKELELPHDFARSVVANAEANVSGLRQPSEIYNFLFVCITIGLFVLFAAGASAREILGGTYAVFDQAAVVAAFVGHLVYDLFLGIAIVLRSFTAQFRVDVVLTVLASILLLVPTVFLSRKMLRVGRA
jgi:anti-sigma factor RsiW